jgi:hypothetical protein
VWHPGSDGVWQPGFGDTHKQGMKQFCVLCRSEMADPPPSPTPTVFNTPDQQTNRAVDDITHPLPPVSQVPARTSLHLAFQTPSASHCSAASAASSMTSMPMECDEESIAAGNAAATAAIDDCSTQLPVCLLNLAGRNDVGSNLSSVLEEAKEQGDGGDSHGDGSHDAQDHDGAMKKLSSRQGCKLFN